MSVDGVDESVVGVAGSINTSPAPMVIQHAPMSERQQLALIKRLEKANAANNQTNSPQIRNSSDALLVSPPRAPLQVVNDLNGGNINAQQQQQQNSSSTTSTSTSTSGTSSAASTPNNAASTPSSLRRSSLPQSPTVERLLKKISKKNSKGETPLHAAAIRGSSRLVGRLLQMGADPNAQDNAEWSPLHEACNRGNIAVVRVLHEFGADLNLKGFAKDSPLHDAARNGHLKVVKFLTRAGADLFARNAAGRTPREEAELIRLRCTDNHDLDKTIGYLIEHEDEAVHPIPRIQGVQSSHSSGQSSPTVESADEDEESENDDLAKFLGVAKSPVVQQALQSLGLASGGPQSPSIGLSGSKNRTVKTGSRSGTPTSGRVKDRKSRPGGNTINRSSFSEQSKIRLTFGMEDKAKQGQAKATGPTSTTSTAPGGSTSGQKTDDVYEFKSSSKEATPSSRASSSPDAITAKADKVDTQPQNVTTTPAPAPVQAPPPPPAAVVVPAEPKPTAIGSNSQLSEPEPKKEEKAVPAEKRSLEVDEDEKEAEESKKKRRREEVATSTSTTATSTSATPAAPAATTVVATTAAPVKGGRGTRGSSSEKTLGGKIGAKTGRPTTGSKSPPSSATSSPRKPPSRDHSDDEAVDEAKKATDSNQLKVPPLKIVLSGQNNGNGNNASSNNSPTTTGTSGTPACQPSSSDADQLKKSSAVTTGDTKDAKEDGSGGGPYAEAAATPADMSDESDTCGTSLGTRLTRSRANQGTPGPADQPEDAPTSTMEPSTAVPASNMQPSTSTAVSGALAVPGPSTSSASAGPSQPSSSYTDYHVKKRKLRSQVEEGNSGQFASNSILGNGSNASAAQGGSGYSGGDGNGSTNGGRGNCASTSAASAANGCQAMANNEPLNDIEKYLNIRKQVEQRRKNLFPVQPKPPQGFKDYLMNRKTYLLQGNAHERLRSIPMIQPPPSLDGPLRELFKVQEEDRYKLRMKHVVEKEKLVLAVEQEILRVHGRAARALANQSLPYSVCTILRDEEIYTPIDPQQEEKNRDIRSRYNGRLFLSWLQDVDDKWEKIKEQMVLRHHNEAESLNAVQKMDWEWKMDEIAGGNGPGRDALPQIDDLHIPMVHVSDDFDLSNS